MVGVRRDRALVEAISEDGAAQTLVESFVRLLRGIGAAAAASLQAAKQISDTAIKVAEAATVAAAEAARRLERYGRNELPETPPVPAWVRFLAQFA